MLGHHGVQVANQTRNGKLVLLETSTASVLVLDIRHREVHPRGPAARGRRAQLRDLGRRAAACWSPTTPQGVIWKVRRDGTVSKWFASRHLQGVEFGTTGIVYRRGQHDLLISQQTTLGGDTLPTNGALFRLPVTAQGRPGRLSTLWTSRPARAARRFRHRPLRPHLHRDGRADRPAGRALGHAARSSTASPTRRSAGDNGSPIPFDTPCSATFLGTKVLVANQSAIFGDASHQAILAVEVGERGRAPYLPKQARFRAVSLV